MIHIIQTEKKSKHRYSTILLCVVGFIFVSLLVFASLDIGDNAFYCTDGATSKVINGIWSCSYGSFGEFIYHNESVPLVITIGSANTYYNISPLDLKHNYNMDNIDSAFRINIAGYYRVGVVINYIGSVNNQYEIEVFINGFDTEHCSYSEKVSTANNKISGSIQCIDFFNKDDIINLRVENENDANNMNIYFLNFNVNLIESQI